MDTLGLIGLGFVGYALYEGFKDKFLIETYDLLAERSSTKSIEDLMSKTKVIFIAVSTPITKENKPYMDHIHSIFSEISKYNDNHIIVLKSSIQPGTSKLLSEKYNLDVVFNPEFLREKTHIQDFKEQKYIILGGEKAEDIEKIYNVSFPEVPVYKTDTSTAEMVKFFINVFLATKVSLCNEIFDICEKLDVNYDNVKNLVQLDDRIGNSHMRVPGDPAVNAEHGRGFGLTCFPLNICILIDLANNLNLDSKILKAVKKRNDELDRPEKDWAIPGKTVI